MRSARVLTWAGILVVVIGIVDLIWTQLTIGGRGGGLGFPDTAEYRWQVATGPLFLIGIGLLVTTASLILQAMHRQRLESD